MGSHKFRQLGTVNKDENIFTFTKFRKVIRE